MPDPTISPQT